MNVIEYNKLYEPREIEKVLISINDLPRIDGELYSGTLLYGYTIDRETFHVYAKDGILHAITYDVNKKVVKHVQGKEIETLECRPSKRAYGDDTQYFFVKMLFDLGEKFTVLKPAESNVLEMGGFVERGLVL